MEFTTNDLARRGFMRVYVVHRCGGLDQGIHMSNKDIDIDQFDARLAAAYAREEDKQQQYDEWAASYDADLVDDLDYVAWRDAGDIFAGLVEDREQRVLDVACGTGLAGKYLRSLGYQNIDGADFSREMLALAEKRAVYDALWQHDFTTAKDLEERYDCLLCVGLFSFAVPKITDLHHVVNCVEAGGLCVITVNGAAWRQLALEPEVYRQAHRHGFRIEQIIEAEYIRKQDIDARVLVIRR
ncbi:MAG: methyltransferase domain-containing protein [Gammaproteobacteria bacterium]|nr:methyltransferase domain-containing protein [Gammaproteobacteria bacterium]